MKDSATLYIFQLGNTLNIFKSTKTLVVLGSIIGAGLGSMLYKKQHPKDEWVIVDRGKDYIKIVNIK